MSLHHFQAESPPNESIEFLQQPCLFFTSATLIQLRTSSMSALGCKIQRTPLTPQIKRDIIRYIWPAPSIIGTWEYGLDWEPYFNYYEHQCEDALHEQGKHVLFRTHQQIIDIASKLWQDQYREEIRADLKIMFTTDEMLPDEDEILDNSLDLAARLCLMVNIGAYESMVTQGTRLLWSSPSLKDFVRTLFTSNQEVNDGNIRFEKVFTGYNMQRIADMKICWTNNLADHLRMVNDDDKMVAIFHHASFLRYQKNNPIFPPGLVDETLRTLALFFPKDDKQTKKWLQALPASSMVDRSLLRCEKLRPDDRQIGRFKFWHDRLIVVKQSFDESRPSKLSQWWYDRRDGYSWYTFWVAVFVLFLTVLFGLVQSIEGALQAYKAYYPTTTT
jgi:hypothetical protein